MHLTIGAAERDHQVILQTKFFDEQTVYIALHRAGEDPHLTAL